MRVNRFLLWVAGGVVLLCCLAVKFDLLWSGGVQGDVKGALEGGAPQANPMPAGAPEGEAPISRRQHFNQYAASIDLRRSVHWSDLRDASGHIVLTLEGEGTGALTSVEVSTGIWNGHLQGDQVVRVISIDANGDAYMPIGEQYVSPAAPDLVLDYERASSWTVEVVDSRDLAQCTDVTLYHAPTDEIATQVCDDLTVSAYTDSGAIPLATGFRSPLSVSGDSGGGFYIVHSPGYVPTRFQRSDMQRKISIRLVPKCELLVFPHASMIHKGGAIELRVRAIPDGGEMARPILTPDPLHFGALNPGQYEVTAVVASLSPPKLMGSKLVELEAGQQLEVVLSRTPAGTKQMPVSTPLVRATVVLPAEVSTVGDWRIRVWKKGVEGLRKISDESVNGWEELSPGVAFARSMAGLEEGAYVLSTHPVRRELEFAIADEPLDLLVDLSDLATIRLDCSSISAGGVDSQIRWGYTGEGKFQNRLAAPGTAHLIDFYCEPGSVSLFGIQGDWVTSHSEVRAVAGGVVEVVLPPVLQQAARMHLVVWDGSTHAQVDPNDWLSTKISSAGGGGNVLNIHCGGLWTPDSMGAKSSELNWAQATVRVSALGDYRVQMPKFGIDEVVTIDESIARVDVSISSNEGEL